MTYLNTIRKAIVALFAASLTYVAGQLATGEPINYALAASYLITAFLVWLTSNEGSD